ncbi:hypothetical protein HDU96_009594, partial [Phlyctochytrium bullatum]
KCDMDLKDWADAASSSPPADLDIKMLRISEDVAKGLAFINNVNIIHNDLKPRKVFVDRYRKPYIGDFGVATHRGEPLIGYTKQYFDKESLNVIPDERSDSWLLRATLWEFRSDEPFNVGEEVYLNHIRNSSVKDVLKNLLRPRERRPSAKQILSLFDSSTTRTVYQTFQIGVNSVKLVKTLLDFGADHQRKDDNGKLPIQLSTSVDRRMKTTSARGYYSEHPSIPRPSSKRTLKLYSHKTNTVTPLHVAACHGHALVCQVLHQAGAFIDTLDNEQSMPLIWATLRGHPAAAQLLIAAGASLEAADKDGWTPLICAAYHGHAEIVRILLDSGANVEARNDKKETPLNKAAAMGHLGWFGYWLRGGRMWGRGIGCFLPTGAMRRCIEQQLALAGHASQLLLFLRP